MISVFLSACSINIEINRSLVDILNSEIDFCENSSENCIVVIEVTEYKRLDDNNYYNLMNNSTTLRVAEKQISNNASIFKNSFTSLELEELYFVLINDSINSTIRRDVSSTENAFVYEIYTLVNNSKFCSGVFFQLDGLSGQSNCIKHNIVENIQFRVGGSIQPQLVGDDLPNFENSLNLDSGITLISLEFKNIDKNQVGSYRIDYTAADEYGHTYSNFMNFVINPYEVMFISNSDFSELTFNHEKVLVYFDKNNNSYRFIDIKGISFIDVMFSQIYKLNETRAIINDKKDGLFKIIDFSNQFSPLILETELSPQTQLIPEFSFEGFIVFSINNYMGLLDSNGQIIIPPTFNTISAFNQKYYMVFKDGLLGINDLQGNSVLSPEFSNISDFEHKGLNYYKLTKSDGSINIVDREFVQVNINDPKLLVTPTRGENGRWALINGYGEELTEFIYYRIYQEGSYLILHEPLRNRLEGNKSVRDLFGQLLYGPDNLDSINIIQDYAILKPRRINSMTVYDLNNSVDILTKTNVTYEIKNEDSFGNERYVVYRENSRYSSIIFRDGYKIIEDAFMISGDFVQSASLSNVEMKTINGKTIIRGYEFNYSSLRPTTRILNTDGDFDNLRKNYYQFEDKFYLTLKGIPFGRRNGGIVSEDGQIIVNFNYDEIIVDLLNEIIVVKKSNESGIYDMFGKVLVPLSVGEITPISGNIYKVNSQVVRFPNLKK